MLARQRMADCYCGTTFYKEHSNHKFCSVQCQLAQRYNKPVRKLIQDPIRCDCGATGKVLRSRVRNGERFRRRECKLCKVRWTEKSVRV